MWQFCETVSSGSVLIRDRAGKEHSFVGNFTTVEIDVVKDDVVIVEGRIAFLDALASLELVMRVSHGVTNFS